VRILVTGSFGNIGVFATRELVARGHLVRCFELRTRATLRTAKRLKAWADRIGGQMEIVWGDLRRPAGLAQAVEGQEAIVHLAGVIPPLSEVKPEWAREINVDGTRNLIKAAVALPKQPRFVFASSVSVFGKAQDQPPPRTADEPVYPSDHYSGHKVACERFLMASGLEWAVLRFGAVPTVALQTLDQPTLRLMFEVPLDTRIELIHPADAGLAVANTVLSNRVWGKVLLIGGGPSCQLYQRVYVGRILDAAGIGRLPERAFGQRPFYTDWMDTTESEHLLSYQRHTADDFIREMAAVMGPKRGLARLFRPFVRNWLLRSSPYLDRRTSPFRRRRPRLA